MVDDKMFNVFFRPKPAMMLVTLRENQGAMYASALAKSIDCTYSHIVKILNEIEKKKLVIFEKHGRLKLLHLTKKGEEVADNIEKIRSIL
ncbi:hypothetical protein JXM83_04830 [Candidatus Woesearchaeota archaeon]|nr:hypothetical protein [Candidatus Woesearchaeota archaeon]